MRDNTTRAVALRSYRRGDWKAMYALDLICFEPPFRFGQREMRRLAQEPGAMTVLAEADSELAGFCIAHTDSSWAYLVTLDVAPAWRRSGLARRLMREVEAQASASGVRGMGLHVFNGNAAAIAFYEQIGYSRVGFSDGFYGGSRDALIYRKTW